LKQLDRINFVLMLAGFVLLTVGMGAGCLWNRSLNSLVQRSDPLVLASTIVWFVYAALLLARLCLRCAERNCADFTRLVRSGAYHARTYSHAAY